MNDINKNKSINNAESSRIYSLFYSFFLIPLMIVVFGILFYLLFSVITEEPTDINQLLIKLETGSVRDKANASYRMNKLFFNDPSKYNASYRNRIIKIHNMSKSEYLSDNSLRLHTIMIMGNSADTTFGSVLVQELSAENEEFRILEVGSYAGNSAATWAEAIQSSGQKFKIICVDRWGSYVKPENGMINKAPIIMDQALKNDKIFKLFNYNMSAAGISKMNWHL